MSNDEAGPDRRAWLLSVGAAAALAVLLRAPGTGVAQEASNGWEQEIDKLLGGAKPVDGKLLIDLPEIAENGNTVPFTLSVESPMTEQEHVKSIFLLSTGNPQAMISAFHFTPASGKAAVAGRLRLAKTQDLITVAALSDGRFLMSKRLVKVTIGGCGG